MTTSGRMTVCAAIAAVVAAAFFFESEWRTSVHGVPDPVTRSDEEASSTPRDPEAAVIVSRAESHPPESAISGRIVTAAGEPMANAKIRLISREVDVEIVPLVAGPTSDGSFYFRTNLARTARISIEVTDGNDVPCMLRTAATFEWSPGSQLAVGDLVAIPYATVAIRIEDETHAPIDAEFALLLQAVKSSAAQSYATGTVHRVRSGTVIPMIPPGMTQAVLRADGQIVAVKDFDAVAGVSSDVILTVSSSALAKSLKLRCLLLGAGLSRGAPEGSFIRVSAADGSMRTPSASDGFVYTIDRTNSKLAHVTINDPRFEPVEFRDVDFRTGVGDVLVRGNGSIALTISTVDGAVPDYRAWLWELDAAPNEHVLTNTSKSSASDFEALLRSVPCGALLLSERHSESSATEVFTGVSGGPYQLWVVAPGYAPVSTTVRRIGPHERVDVSASLRHQASVLTARITSCSDGTAVANALVDACRRAATDDSDWSPVLPLGTRSSRSATMRQVIATARTDDEGQCTFSGLPAGEVLLRASVSGDHWRWAVPLELPPSGALLAPICISRAGALRVFVEGATNESRHGIAVAAIAEPARTTSTRHRFGAKHETRIDSSCVAEFKDLDPGSYRLNILLGGGTTIEGANERHMPAAIRTVATVVIEEGKTCNATVQLNELDVGCVAVEIATTSDVLRTGAVAVLVDDKGTGHAREVIDGRCFLGPVPVGDYAIWVSSADGRIGHKHDHDLHVSRGAVVSAKLSIPTAHGVVVVLNESGVALAGVEVRLRSAWLGGFREESVLLSLKGEIEADLSPGSYLVRRRSEQGDLEGTLVWTQDGPAGTVLQLRPK